MEGLAQALLDNHVGTLDPDGREFARRIVGAARDMDALIRDLLAYSRLSHAEIRTEHVDLEAVIRDVLAKLEGLVRERDAEVDVDGSLAPVQGHRTTLLQVVENLVSNAIKFVAGGRRPRVRLRTDERDGRIRLWVEDNGIGIAAEDCQRIFMPLERLHGVDAFPGTGIGLALVEKGIRRMGGAVGVDSTQGRGSRFWVELPRSPV
jgi:signal transduction histidine kinase